MSMVPTFSNCHECRPARFAAAHCVICDSRESLKLVDGEFRCSDPKRCVDYLQARRHAERLEEAWQEEFERYEARSER